MKFTVIMLMFALYLKMHQNQLEILSVRIVSPDATYTNNQIVVNIPNVRKPVPLFILMRALGVISDKAIIETCLLDLKENENYIDLFLPLYMMLIVFYTKSMY